MVYFLIMGNSGINRRIEGLGFEVYASGFRVSKNPSGPSCWGSFYECNYFGVIGVGFLIQVPTLLG